jgi:NADH dehydrogenase
VREKVTRIDLKKKTLIAGKKYTYDYIIIAAGARSHLPANVHALPLKTAEDAVRIRATIESNVKSYGKQKKSSLLHVVVVGGGSTGIEVAGECMDLLRFRLDEENISAIPHTTIIHSREKLLNELDEFFHTAAKKRLEEKKIDVLFNTRVSAVQGTKVLLNNGKELQSSCVIWAAGITPNSIEGLGEGHITIENTLQIKGFPFAFAIGDTARMKRPLPAVAQVASSQGSHVARNILRQIHKQKPLQFKYKSKGYLLSIGQKYGIGKIFNIKMQGFFAWFLMRTIYLMKFKSITAELHLVKEYTIRLFSRDHKCTKLRK